MIVFPVISQRNYIIGDDSIVGYTKKENRTIAIIFQDRDKLEELNFDNEYLINVLQIDKSKLQDNIKQYNIKDSINTVSINELNSKLDNEIKLTKTWKLVGTIGITTTIIFGILNFLK